MIAEFSNRWFALALVFFFEPNLPLAKADSGERSGNRWLRSLQYVLDANSDQPSLNNTNTSLGLSLEENKTLPELLEDDTTNLIEPEETVVLSAMQKESRIPLTFFAANPSANRFPLKRCQGDCDSDSQCEGSLICFQRDENMAVPGCQGGESDSSRSDYCVQPGAVSNPTVQQEEGTPPPPPIPAPAPLPSTSSCDSFFVALLADPQVGWNLDGYNSEELFRVAASHLRELKPEFVLVAGDMIQTAGNRDEYRTSKSIMDSVDLPYYVIAGNHDVRSNPRLSLLNDFVDDWDLPYYWYTVRHCNALFIMLDSNILRAMDDNDADDEILALAIEQLEWLDSTLDEATQDNSIDHIIPIAHHPLATRSLNEESKKTNTPKRVRQDLLDIYEAHAGPKLDYVFAGHFHDSARISDRSSGIDYVTYPATGVILGGKPREPSGFAILRIEGKSLREDYYGYDEMPNSI